MLSADDVVLPVAQLLLAVLGVRQWFSWWKKYEQVGKKGPSVGYLKTRLAVRRWLRSREVGEDRTVMEKIKQRLPTGDIIDNTNTINGYIIYPYTLYFILGQLHRDSELQKGSVCYLKNN